MEPYQLTAGEAAIAISNRELSSEELVSSCVQRSLSRDEEVKAWAFLDPQRALAQARLRDNEGHGEAHKDSAVYGLPIAIKDMIDTADMPTGYNSPIYRDHQPARDAACVGILRGRGAVIMGKAATVEFASIGRMPPTGNPHDIAHTPGGSSSGSAAAVASGMAPLAVGTQTGGSVIRPAAFCGIFAMKPTYGQISTEGIKVYSQSLDTIGFMGRSVDDLERMALALGVVDSMPAKATIKGLKIGLFRTPHWQEADKACQDIVELAARTLGQSGAAIEDIGPVAGFDELSRMQDRVMHWDGRGAYRKEYITSADMLHRAFHDEVENAKGRTRAQIIEAHDAIAMARRSFEARADDFDAWITPAVPGEAPRGLETNGLATFNRLWTALHCPCVTIPFGSGPGGLPIGIQLTAPRLRDDRLLAVAALVAEILEVQRVAPVG